MKSCLKGHGGKFYLAPAIVGKLGTPHKLYVEPFFFTGAVLLEKPYQGVAEVANDIDGNLTCFWSVLQDRTTRAELIERLRFTPFSQEEFRHAQYVLDHDTANIVEKAAAYFVVCRQSMAGRLDSFAPMSKARVRRGMSEQVAAWLGAVDGLYPVAERMMRVAIFNDKASAVIEREDSKDTLFYLDPPYMPETRVSDDVYRHEMTVAEHTQLLSQIVRCKGKVAISGYRCPLYDYHLADWNVTLWPIAAHCSSSDIKGTRLECLWRNYE